MTLSEFIEKVLKYNPKADTALLKKAYVLAEKAHQGQTRSTGEDYFTHPIGVAAILMKMYADSATLCAALLHDIVEDTSVSIEQVKQLFGEEIALLVEGVTKIEKIHFKDSEDYKAENIRKILIATAKDVRVILIKLADRLHNMQTLKTFRPEKQQRIAMETLEIYAPVAHKLGMWRLKGELEDLSLRYLEPEVYKFLRSKVAEKRAERENSTEEMIATIKQNLAEKHIDALVYGRAKYFYSIYKKMKKKKIGFNDIYDLVAIRIITKTMPECYAALGIVHDLWKPMPHRFKDYIAVPKANGYQSLHTTVVTNKGKIVEIQIRTEEMHHISEDGIAAHWKYHGTERDKKFDKKISWLKQILEWKRHSKDAADFIESLKVDLFDDEIVVFTPKGDPISLPINATPVDFAYMVHTNIGNKCSKALVNNKIVPLDYNLESGDIVEIIVNKNAEPSRQWLKSVKTAKARTKIKNTLKIEHDHDPKAERLKHDSSEDALYSVNEIYNRIEAIGKNYPLKVSKCCDIKINDKIKGFITKDNKITVHKEGCINIHTMDKKREVALLWKIDNEENIIALRLLLEDKVGLLARILSIFAANKINIKSVNTKQRKEKVITTIRFYLKDKEKLHGITSKIKQIKSVLEIAVEDK
ncbi:bifunctional (p)ppGpp synthetase/guanosine-3',5'-bis(diphosphate) 3'-pyrophosphohydrolase [Candidatus Woesearchaeota archaeon]|nr:bifunctional (p)ppGpp synthetase/guanosine-3',5'-bis(diphosphate) 3'-pyrophosphohydrolase [Candidatus Woesearchaeota archaeon]